MNQEGDGQRNQIDRIMVGEPISAGGYTLEPVARARGWYGGGDGEQGRGFGAMLRVRPVEVRVSDSAGVEQTVQIVDPSADAVRQIAMSALFVAAVSLVLMLVAGIIRLRR
jgi:hypothetical protein